MKAKFKKAKVIIDGEDAYLCVAIPFMDAKKFVAEMKPDKEYVQEIKEYKKPRSLDSNAYFWTLCGQLAAKLSSPLAPVTPDDVYRNCIRDIGDNYVIQPVREDLIEVWDRLWCKGHTGRFTVDLGKCRTAKRLPQYKMLHWQQ